MQSGASGVSPQVQYHLMLHIQMQLCELSLWDWIAERNRRGRECVDESACKYRVDLRALGWEMRMELELPSASSCFGVGKNSLLLNQRNS